LAMSGACVGLKSEREGGPMAQVEFEECLLGSIDDGLADILGEQFKETFYKHIEQKFHIARSSLPNRLDLLASALSVVLGDTGGVVMGRAIAKRLYLKLGIGFMEKTGWTLVEYFDHARKREDAWEWSD
jgi:hypothetical protein